MDALDARSVPDELIDAWLAREQRVLKSKYSGRGHHHEMRDVVLSLLKPDRMLSPPAEAGHDHYLEALQVFDLHCMDISKAPTDKVILRASAAYMGTLKLRGLGSLYGTERAMYQKLAKKASDLSLAHGGKRLTVREIQDEESLLVMLGKGLTVTSIAGWIGALAVRIDVATEGVFNTSLMEAHEVALNWAAFLVQYLSISSEYPPHALAVGLYGIALASVGALSPDVLKPVTSSSTHWGEIFESVLDHTPFEVTIGSVDLSTQAVVVAAFEFAATCELSSVCSNVLIVLEVLRYRLVGQTQSLACRGG